METRICSHCKIKKPLNEFYKDSFREDGYHTNCKSCHDEYTENWIKNNREKCRENNKKYLKIYYQKNKDAMLEQMHDNYLKNKDRLLKYIKQWNSTPNGKRSKLKSNIKHRGLGNTELFENILDSSEQPTFHHVDDLNGLYLPNDLHFLYLSRDTENHRENLLPIIIQLYPEINIVSYRK